MERGVRGEVSFVVSDITLAELAGAPLEVRRIVEELPPSCVEIIQHDRESEALAEEYLRQAVVSRRMFPDAMHIATATVTSADVLVSWNFRHIVNLDKIRGFNAVNFKLGYSMLEIRSPLEVIKDDNEDF